MVVSASPYEHMIGKPDVKYIGNIHGNEPVGKELLLHMIQYLVTSYTTDPYIRWLLDNTRIHILPSLNPDGYAISKEGTCDGAQGRWDNCVASYLNSNWNCIFIIYRCRYNARGFDLNRNFPDYFKPNAKREQPETDAVKEWISKIQFVLSGSLHGGALVASYPYDNTPNSSKYQIRDSNYAHDAIAKSVCFYHEIDPFHESRAMPWTNQIKNVSRQSITQFNAWICEIGAEKSRSKREIECDYISLWGNASLSN